VKKIQGASREEMECYQFNYDNSRSQGRVLSRNFGLGGGGGISLHRFCKHCNKLPNSLKVWGGGSWGVWGAEPCKGGNAPPLLKEALKSLYVLAACLKKREEEEEEEEEERKRVMKEKPHTTQMPATL
jgi:hypothetical protein